MKGLTICEPYATLIALPDDHSYAKRVENRTWGTRYRGSLLIHAGVSRSYADPDVIEDYGLRPSDLNYGCALAVATLRGCVELELGGIVPEWARYRWPWLGAHEHTEGPVCWVLAEVRRLPQPIPLEGVGGAVERAPGPAGADSSGVSPLTAKAGRGILGLDPLSLGGGLNDGSTD
jgi:hypothetical protein